MAGRGGGGGVGWGWEGLCMVIFGRGRVEVV